MFKERENAQNEQKNRKGEREREQQIHRLSCMEQEATYTVPAGCQDRLSPTHHLGEAQAEEARSGGTQLKAGGARHG